MAAEQRKFAQSKSRLSASEARVTVIDTMRVLRDASESPEIKTVVEEPTIVDPVDYEIELTSKKKVLENEEFKDLLLFPHNDISVISTPLESRTEISTVPPNALQDATNLFTRECLKLYSSDWHRLAFNFEYFSQNYSRYVNKISTDGISAQVFESDIVETEKQNYALNIARSRTLTKQGYLLKGLFWNEGAPVNSTKLVGSCISTNRDKNIKLVLWETFDEPSNVVGKPSKAFKKRWFVLKFSETDGSFILEYFKDEKSSSSRGKIILENCEEIKKNSKLRPQAFEIIGSDEKEIYNLAAETSDDLEDWIVALSKAMNLLTDAKSSLYPTASLHRDKTMQDSHKGIDFEKVKCDAGIEEHNRSKRQEARQLLFNVYPELTRPLEAHEYYSQSHTRTPVPTEHFVTRFLVKDCKLDFRVVAKNKAGSLGHIEPFFVSLALYDAAKGQKISENFHMDLNDRQMQKTLDERESIEVGEPQLPKDMRAIGASSLNINEKWPVFIKQAIFSVTFPNPDVFLVARIDKILQSSISQCADNYIKAADNTKASEKLATQISSFCKRIGYFKMPFAFAVCPVFNSSSMLEKSATFSSLYKQEKERLSDEDILKLLLDHKSMHKQKLPTLPGLFSVSMHPVTQQLTGTLTASLIPVAPFATEEASAFPDQLTKEVKEFAPLKAYHPHLHYYPHTTYVNTLYIYPLSLKYDTQKVFSKARNITCCIQLKDSDDPSLPALPVIYGRTGETVFTDRYFTNVLHHCTTPAFYDEIKMELPIHLHSKHHILITFYHISCDASLKGTKSGKLPPVASPVGYCWISLLDSDNKFTYDCHHLPVSNALPSGYLSNPLSTSVNSTIKWVESKKFLFRINIKLESTVFTQDTNMHRFFSLCDHLWHRTPISEAEIQSSLVNLEELGLCTTVQYLPVLFNQLLKLLISAQQSIENSKVEIIMVLLNLLDMLHNANKSEGVLSYVEHIFLTEFDSDNNKAVHDEIAKNLVQFLRQNKPEKIKLLFEHIAFFFELMVKSMAQYLDITNKMKASRKSRFPEDYQWNLQSLITTLHIRIQEYGDMSAKNANMSLAVFVKKCFNFVDRGVMFKVVQKYMSPFQGNLDNQKLYEMKFDFLRVLCSHEHFIPLNLPFAIKAHNYEAELNDDFCRQHFLVGLLLKEVELVLNSGRAAFRNIALNALRDVIAKHDLDPRYTDLNQKARIAALYMPIITIALDHVSRIDTGSIPIGSPMLGSTSIYPEKNTTGSMSLSPIVLPPSSPNEHLPTPMEDSRKFRNSIISVSPTSSLHKHDSTILDGPKYPDNASVQSFPSPAVVMQSLNADWSKLSKDESRNFLICVLFVLKHLDNEIMISWWKQCVASAVNLPANKWATFEEKCPSNFSELMLFFDLLETCIYIFQYRGKKSLSYKLMNQVSRSQDHIEPLPTITAGSTSKAALATRKKQAFSTPNVNIPLQSQSSIPVVVTSKHEGHDIVVLEGACANETSLVILDILDVFAQKFENELSQNDGDNVLMAKYFALYATFLQVNQSEWLLGIVFDSLRSFINKFPSVLYRGSPEYCGLLCYQVLLCCNSRLHSVREEAASMLYLLMRRNYAFFNQQGFVRMQLQSLIAVSKIVSTMLDRSDSNLKRSLVLVSAYTSVDEEMATTSFPTEVSDIVKRLKTVLNATGQMKEHKYDPERLLELHYSLAKSYADSPQLRQTWLESIVVLHKRQGNFSEAAHCCIHIAGLIAEYLKQKGIYQNGCHAFKPISPNVELEESGIKVDKEFSESCQYSEQNLINFLEVSIDYLLHAERYETAGEISKLIIPFYEKNRQFKKLSCMYNKLFHAYNKIVEVAESGKRCLGTYFRVSFYGSFFGEDNSISYIYKEPKVTKLTEITERLTTLYTKKFGSDVVVIIQESGRVDPSKLDPLKAYLQITHVMPYFSSQELLERTTSFERNDKISRFVFETPFTRSGKAHGSPAEQCMRKTILTVKHWFPYIKTRIEVVDTEIVEISPIEVAIEAMERKMNDLQDAIKKDPPDIKLLQLLLQGSISTQVNQGAMEYANVFLKRNSGQLSTKHVMDLKEIYRQFMHVCQEALELNGRLIEESRTMYHEDLKRSFLRMEYQLSNLLPEANYLSTSDENTISTTLKRRKKTASIHSQRMSVLLFQAISGGK